MLMACRTTHWSHPMPAMLWGSILVACTGSKPVGDPFAAGIAGSAGTASNNAVSTSVQGGTDTASGNGTSSSGQSASSSGGRTDASATRQAGGTNEAINAERAGSTSLDTTASGGSTAQVAPQGGVAAGGKTNSAAGGAATGGTTIHQGGSSHAAGASTGSPRGGTSPNGSGVEPATAGANATGGAANRPICSNPTTGACPNPSQLTAFRPSGTVDVGCYEVPGLAANKMAILEAGSTLPEADQGYMPYLVATAMMETNDLDTDYVLGDNKSGDAFTVGVAKQHWGMLRQCHSAWNGLVASDYATSVVLNTDRVMDARTYVECRAHFGDQWWALHLGLPGDADPSTDPLPFYRSGVEFIHQMLESDPNGNSHYCDDLRFWISNPAGVK